MIVGSNPYVENLLVNQPEYYYILSKMQGKN